MSTKAVVAMPSRERSLLALSDAVLPATDPHLLQRESLRLLELIASGAPLAACLRELTAAMGSLRGDVRAAVLLADDERRQIGNVHSAALPESFGRNVMGAEICENPIGTCGKAIYAGEPVACPDVAGPHRWAPQWRDLCLAHGVRACHSMPIFSASGTPVASLFFCFETVRPPESLELELAAFGARIASLAIERDRTLRALREADRRKDDFIAVLAHELRNPLAPLRNALQVLSLTRSTEPMHQVMSRQVEQLTRLVDDLLDVSRISHGKIEIRREPLDLRALLSQVLDVVQPAVAGSGHQLEARLALKPLILTADAVRLSQVFTNLLQNAIKYTPRGGHLTVESRREDKMAIVSVRDDGMGIAADQLERIFEPFAQAAGARGRAQGGIGVGLALARKLVEMHGGTLTASSDGPGKGSDFTVRLPVAQDAIVSRNDDAVPEIPRLARVLVVDDNRDAADVLGVLLRLIGAEVQVVHSGDAALLLLESFRPALVLLDLGMPGMDGYETARRIRAKYGALPKLVAVSGWGQPADRARTKDAGFDDHLLKPVDAKTIAEILAAHTSVRPNLAV